MLAFGHALVSPAAWQNSIWKCCDYKSLAKDRIWPAGLLLFCLPAFPTLIFMVKQCLRHHKTKIPWDQFTRDIFWWHVAPQWAVLWNQCWVWGLSCTFITSSSWLACSLPVSPPSPSLGLWMASPRNPEGDSWPGDEGHWRISSETLAALPGCYTIQRQNQ